jgi:hypothetical protein
MGSWNPHARACPDRRGPAALRARAVEWIARAISMALLVSTAEHAFAASLPILAGDVFLASANSVQSFTVDLGTLPTRPILEVTVTPDATDSTMQLEITATNWQGMPGQPGFCPTNGTTSPPSTSGPGVATYQNSLFNCDPRPGAFVGDTVTIQVRAVHFGSGAPPATVAVEIRGVTRPPTTTLNQQVDTNLSPQQLVFPAVRDTVLYEDDTAASNGAGQFLWAGERVTVLPTTRTERRSLVAFDVTPAITPVSEIDAAVFRVGVTSVLGGGGTLRMYSLAPDGVFQWPEGNADAPDSELIGTTSTFSAADWLFRQPAIRPWLNPGGDVLGAPLAQLSITSTGTRSLSSTALAEAVQGMVSTGNSRDGFLLAGPAAGITSTAIQLASSESTSVTRRPELVVDFTPTQPYETGNVSTNVVSFLDEGQNFRWIYDLDQDNIFVTPIDGVCEALTDLGDRRTMPYTYRYQGTPGFIGVDCCTWRIEAQQAGVVGTGQALFFHNLDASNPAHMPPDTDQDGIRDLCDNCPSVPNGPLAGVCLAGPLFRAPCYSNESCGSGGICSLSQEDANGDFQGDACVPEPGLGVGLLAGLSLIATWSRSASRRRAWDHR